MPVEMPVLDPNSIPLDIAPVSTLLDEAPDRAIDSGTGGNSPVGSSLLTGSDPDYATISGQALRHGANAGGRFGGSIPQPATPGNSVMPQLVHATVRSDAAGDMLQEPASEW